MAAPTINVSISIYGECSPADLAQIMGVLKGEQVSVTETVKTSKPAAKAPKAATPQPEAAEPDPTPEAEVEQAEGTNLTIDDLKDAMKGFNEKNGRDALVELLGRFGVKNVSAVPENQFAAFYAACQE